MTDPILLFIAVAALVVVGCIVKVGRPILHQDSGGWDSTEEQVLEGVVILRAEPAAPQYREPIQVRRIPQSPARVSHASPETATGSVAYQGRHHAAGPDTARVKALKTRTQFVQALQHATAGFEEIAALEGHPVREHGPREPVHTRTYTPPLWEQAPLPLRGMPPIVEEVR